MDRFIALMYHNLAEQPVDEYAVRPSAFADQLAWLNDNGYVVEGFRELQVRLSEFGPYDGGRYDGDQLAQPAPWPERYCLLTFDDGHVSNLQAAEMVREAGFQATFFVTRRAILEQPDFLDEDGVRELADLCSVGTHGDTHRPLTDLTPQQLEHELAGTRTWLEDLTGESHRFMSAPGGDLDRAVLRQALDSGYRLVGDSTEWWNRPERIAQTHLVHRVMIFESYDLETFARLVRCDRTLLLRRRLRSLAVTSAKRVLPSSLVGQLSRLKQRLLAPPRQGKGS